MNEENKSIGALWAKKSQSGESYLSGVIEVPGGPKFQIVAFKNTKKEEGSKQPDFRILLSKPRE